MDAPSEAAPSENVERYLETIYYIEHEGEVVRPGRLAEWLGVSAPTVSVSVQRLARDGWVTIGDDRSVRLTERGAAVAAAVVRRHRIVERWLTDVLGFDWSSADREAWALARGMSDAVLERLDVHLGHPLTCPHGNVVPGRRPPSGRPLVRLTEIEPGLEAPIARISEVAEHDAPQLLGMLDSAGLTPGVEIRIVASDAEGLRAVAAGREVSLPHAVASAIWVQMPAAPLAVISREGASAP